MFHDLIVFFILGIIAGFVSLMFFALSRPERYRDKMEWWKAEGVIIFVIAWIVLVVVALSGHIFHLAR